MTAPCWAPTLTTGGPCRSVPQDYFDGLCAVHHVRLICANVRIDRGLGIDEDFDIVREQLARQVQPESVR